MADHAEAANQHSFQPGVQLLVTHPGKLPVSQGRDQNELDEPVGESRGGRSIAGSTEAVV